MLETRLLSRGLATFLATLTVGACDGDEMEGDDDSRAVFCENEDRADAFRVDLSKSSTHATVRIVDAVPAKPGRGDNTWTVMLTDANGAPLEGQTLDSKPWMPDHGHGSPVEETVTELGEGEYEIENLNLFMPGFWDVTLDMTDESGDTDEVVFAVCVD